MPLSVKRSTYTASAAPPSEAYGAPSGRGATPSAGFAGVGSYAGGGGGTINNTNVAPSTRAGTVNNANVPPSVRAGTNVAPSTRVGTNNNAAPSTRAAQSVAPPGTFVTVPSEYIYTVGILTISDTAAKHPDTDTSGPLIRSVLEAHPADAFRIVGQATVPDDIEQIRKYVKMWTDQQRCALVLTTGGTGFGVRDSTTEAITPLITKVTPALTHALTAFSVKKTPYAVLSRAITGIRQPAGHGTPGTLIVCMPGSAKAVREYCDFLFGEANQGLILHALDLIQGGTGKEVHQDMQREGTTHARSASSSSSSGIGSYSPSVAQFSAGGKLGTHVAAASLHSHTHSHGGQSHNTPRPRTLQGSEGGAAYITHDPTGAASTRHRISPYPILDLDQALGLIDRFTPSPNMPRITTSTNPGLSGNPLVTTTSLSILPTPHAVGSGLRGHVLAEDVRATADLPPGPTSNVDGYAVSANETAIGEYKVITASTLARRAREGAAGASMPRHGEVYRINTGQGLPLGTDAVVMVEDTILVEAALASSATSPAGEERRIRILAQIDVGENVRPKGSDVSRGTVVLQKGTTLGALGGEIGTLAFVGRKEVLVYPKPRVAVLSTGTELLDVSLAPGMKRVGEEGAISPKVGAAVQAAAEIAAQQQPWGFTVYDANRPGLIAAIEGQGFEVIDLGIVGDDLEATTKALRRGLKHADIVITTGGTSMGESDLLKPIIERELRGAIHFGRVAMKPGKPTTFATIAATDPNEIDRLLFALPGNPASALVCFYVFVLPSLRKLAGHSPTTPLNQHQQYAERGRMGGPVEDESREPIGNPWSLPKVTVVLAQSVMTDARPEFHRVVVRAENGQFVAYSTGSQRSSGMHSMATANALVCVPARRKDMPIYRLEAGEKVEAILLG
ncbi:hypothetical protein A4X13_0g6275 [Tilletia indica]|uniref:MoaB/Mog domain-containing protein n=1 Tax=Tilletia indica TaxID=43049 RepID=A0A177TE64_9BASI|nr:hypothetical protein A4X13_0g6275 [Tilletia indica]